MTTELRAQSTSIPRTIAFPSLEKYLTKTTVGWIAIGPACSQR
jgi:hypothetical protein